MNFITYYLSFADTEVIPFSTYKSISLLVFAVVCETDIPRWPDGCEPTNQPRQ